MRNLTARWTLPLLVTLGLLVGSACSGDDGGGNPTSTTATTAVTGPTTTPTVANDVDLVPLLVTVEDLPDGFSPTPEVGDTVTSFCAGEDAAAGLQASGRAIAGYGRTPAGVSVLQVVFRFRTDDATDFVRQAGEILERCDNVPDVTGLAFDYEDVPPDLLAALTVGTDAATAAIGTSAGSGSLRSVVGVVRRGDLASLVAVLAVDTDPGALNDVARTVFTAAATRLAAG